MARTLRLALAQLNPTVGDVPANLALLRSARAQAAGMGADVVMLPELFLSAYPPEDLVLKPAFVDACRMALDEICGDTRDHGPAVLVGLPLMSEGLLRNAYVCIDGGRVTGARLKVDLPNYGVFDEKRVFAAGPLAGPVAFRNLIRLGLPICEDIWGPEPVECIAETGGELLLVPNGSPYEREKADTRLNIALSRVSESGLPLVYLNQVGGQDELVFDGASFGLHADGSLAFQMTAFREEVALTVWTEEGGSWRCIEGPKAIVEEGDAADYEACVLGLRDYVDKSGFRGVVLGMSGGIDSALCAAMAVDALGGERVRCVMLPYLYTAQASLDDAEACARLLGASYETVPIAPAVEGLTRALAGVFGDLPPDTTEENLQSRVRGTILMSISNKFGPMVVTTGNKSEMSVGYATLYGDMNGGFNPIKDLYKTEVFRLAALRNRWKPEWALGPAGVVIPERIITKPPSAELREGQTDQDSLPPYEMLDDILECLVEREMRVSDIVAKGHALETVRKVEKLLYRAEYKRRQSAPGIKVTRKNFGRDRRYPIVNRFLDDGAPPYDAPPLDAGMASSAAIDS